MIPDIRKDIIVPVPPARAFNIFWSEIGTWWPLHSHSLSGMNGTAASGLRFEPRLGGKIIEVMADGSEAPWGVVTDWQPDRVIEFTWQLRRPPEQATRVRVTFGATQAGTRVTLVHSGWDRLGEEASASRDTYDSGWIAVFVAAYGKAAAGAARAGAPCPDRARIV
jgi:hypothetical protein